MTDFAIFDEQKSRRQHSKVASYSLTRQSDSLDRRGLPKYTVISTVSDELCVQVCVPLFKVGTAAFATNLEKGEFEFGGSTAHREQAPSILWGFFSIIFLLAFFFWVLWGDVTLKRYFFTISAFLFLSFILTALLSVRKTHE